jgi:hypothetical protein
MPDDAPMTMARFCGSRGRVGGVDVVEVMILILPFVFPVKSEKIKVIKNLSGHFLLFTLSRNKRHFTTIRLLNS